MENKVLEILERNFNESIEFDRTKATEELLILFGVSKQSEPLLCECGSTNNSYYGDGKWRTYFCWDCKKELAK